MNNLQVVIDAGHGGTDPGAVSGNVYEKDLTLMISKYMYEQFQKRGIPVTLVRDTDETLSPDERVRRILAAYGDNPNVVILSNHINSSTSSSSEGAEVIYALRNNSTLAENVLQAFANSGQVVRKFYQRRLPSDTSKDYYFIHRNTGSKTQPLIIEYGFINNPTDLARIQNNYKTYVDNIVDAVIATAEGEVVLPGGEDVYIVQAGDSLYSIAKKFGTTVDAIKSLNNLTSNNLSIGQVLRIPSSSSEDTGTTGTYIVQAGDTLYGIANKFNTTVDAIRKLNNLTSDILSIGQVLKIPGLSTDIGTTGTYTVVAGDSLYSIAKKFGTTVDAIKSLNNLTSNNLSIGQVLKIPGLSTDTDTGTGTTGTYTVVSGDSLYSIAKKFGTTVDAIKSLNNLTSNNLSIGQVLKIPGLSSDTGSGSGTTNYTVVSGDTLWNIANRFNTTVDEIKRLNNLTSNMLSIGQTLKIPSTTSSNNYINYTVKSGDSLWNIARKYNTTVDAIKSLNNLTSDNLSIGQTLRIPS